ncbi:MAG: tyrosine-type recombinase/integrase [Vulcanimicrobiaceae bacterium]
MPLDELKRGDIDALIDAAQKKKCGHVIRYAFTVLHRALACAVSKQLIPSNPAVGCAPKRPASKKFTSLTAEQCQQFLAAAESGRLYALFVLAITCGLRQGELLGLQWRDVDFENRKLAIRRQVRYLNGKVELLDRTKNGKDRQIMLSRPAVATLQKHREKMRAEITALRKKSVANKQRIGPIMRTRSKRHRKCSAPAKAT